ncbi:hypothetical protein EUTSA_v10005375mg [Eutrema salsugineum]|uniref:DOMON domain-containing protein n=1 Tax=Eutrema salsugineum TaxID=72664 RepID=V4KMA4_EUTSA|nr:cytochrome b561 and DOMON domain-containing protein At5g48750 [Eutrema salsugineum]ESQ32399.1 hypothetical protein EUTSA_v10005375mg [Eutrema salsugineum]
MSLSSRTISVVLCFLFVLAPCFTSATTTDVVQSRCDSHNFNNGKHFRSCIDLPVLDSFLHFSYVRETGVLEVAYRHTNIESSSWIAWGINPTGKGMLGAQTLLVYRNSTSGSMRAYTSSIKSYSTMLQEGPLSFRVTQLSAEYLNGEMTIFATIVLPSNTTVVNETWRKWHSLFHCIRMKLGENGIKQL